MNNINEAIQALNETLTAGSGCYGYYPEGTILLTNATRSAQKNEVAFQGTEAEALAWLIAQVPGTSPVLPEEIEEDIQEAVQEETSVTQEPLATPLESVS